MKAKRFIIILFFSLIFKGGFSQLANNWDTLQSGFLCVVYRMYTDTVTGKLYAGGNFKFAGPTLASGVASWDGVKWDSLGPGIYTGNCAGGIRAIAGYNNKLYVGGAFGNVGSPSGMVVRNIAAWDGLAWDSIGYGVDQYETVLNLKTYGNNLYVCGSFDSINNIKVGGTAKFDGVTWQAIHDTAWNSAPLDIAVYNGEVYICGQLGSTSGGYVYKFNGSGWQLVGGGILGISGASSLEVYNNELYIGGGFWKWQGNAGNCIQKWNGSQWLDVNNGLDGVVRDMVVRNGKLYAAGDFNTADGVPAMKLAVWDGIKWCGAGNTSNNGAGIFTVEAYNNDPYLAGVFTQIDGYQYLRIARYTGGLGLDTCGNATGMNESGSENGIDIYPNPFNEILNVAVKEKSRLEIINIIGETIGRRDLVIGRNEIVLSLLPEALYFILISGPNGTFVKKIVKANK